jgi:hypothetical protein
MRRLKERSRNFGHLRFWRKRPTSVYGDGHVSSELGPRAAPCTPSEHVVRCSGFSGLQTRWAHRLQVQVYLPSRAVFQRVKTVKLPTRADIFAGK